MLQPKTNVYCSAHSVNAFHRIMVMTVNHQCLPLNSRRKVPKTSAVQVLLKVEKEDWLASTVLLLQCSDPVAL